MFGFSLVALSIGFGVGLGVGWFVMKRPAWADKIVNSIFG